jgi:hypothetical protein
VKNVAAKVVAGQLRDTKSAGLVVASGVARTVTLTWLGCRTTFASSAFATIVYVPGGNTFPFNRPLKRTRLVPLRPVTTKLPSAQASCFTVKRIFAAFDNVKTSAVPPFFPTLTAKVLGLAVSPVVDALVPLDDEAPLVVPVDPDPPPVDPDPAPDVDEPELPLPNAGKDACGIDVRPAPDPTPADGNDVADGNDGADPAGIGTGTGGIGAGGFGAATGGVGVGALGAVTDGGARGGRVGGATGSCGFGTGGRSDPAPAEHVHTAASVSRNAALTNTRLYRPLAVGRIVHFENAKSRQFDTAADRAVERELPRLDSNQQPSG